ncbi:hypothetical protein [Chryseobacterium sp. Hurlbut01]|uniref:hypothetical protein n=1 Tax=Chryseobacterium sp. Hurlbut01 TaxID=1681828 RepID=UPI00067CEBDB|nr:hypothetical protein [Chryseobacterium sp. Hurlbut01]KNB60625.1 hypothetical protein AC804_15740 [Chryseobacterium sp. Hurlbut01]
MKRLSLLLFLLPLSFTAQLRLNTINELYVIKSDNIENYVINGLGFKKLTAVKNEGSNDYEFYNGKNNFEEAIYLQILIPFIDKFKNVVTIRTANESYVQELKSDIVSNGFQYYGEKELYDKYKVHLYIKNSITFMISSEKGKNGIFEINMIPLNK